MASQIFQKCNESNARISALASKIGQIKKVKAQLLIIYHLVKKIAFIFWIDSF